MVVGHENQTSFLRSCVEKGTLAHAYLFVGPKGTGKREAVLELLSALMGKEIIWEQMEEKGVLLAERRRDEKTGRTSKEISIETVHQISNYLNHSSFIESRQVVVINDAEFLSKAAANALLKTLEEPKSARALVILLSADENRILPTIKSRCQIIRFFPVSSKKIYDSLIAKGASCGLAEEISRLACNGSEKAEKFFENSAAYNFYKTEADRFLNTLNGSLQERWQKLDAVFKEKEDHQAARENLVSLLEIWLSFWRDSLLFKVGGLEEWVKNISYAEQIKNRFLRYSLQTIQEVIRQIEEAISQLRQNVHPRLILENLILSYY